MRDTDFSQTPPRFKGKIISDQFAGKIRACALFGDVHSAKRVQKTTNAMIKKEKTIILGFGNPDRGDDGVAWHVLAGIAQRFGQPFAYEGIEAGLVNLSEDTHLWFNLQLIPEVAEELAAYQQAIFIDAHTATLAKATEHCLGMPLRWNVTPF